MGFSALLQEQNRQVAQKLGTATALMFTLPLLVFYLCATFVFHETNDPMAWSGGAAVVAVNIVICGYVVSAFSEEDDDTNNKDDPRSSSDPPPKVGIFKDKKKDRTD